MGIDKEGKPLALYKSKFKVIPEKIDSTTPKNNRAINEIVKEINEIKNQIDSTYNLHKQKK